MCGINGIFAYNPSAPGVDRVKLIRTRDHMAARGPDGFGDWISSDGRVGFGHRRLAIIDLSESGAQPMATDDGLLRITFNGEIYNYQELRDELAAEGIRFRGHSDTEVLLHLYRRDGEGMVHRLRGMFAFAIWDENDQRLFLARDPYGIKPLYYSDSGGTFCFASQVKALRTAVSGTLDSAGVTGFLLWGSIPEPFTLYEEIRALPAGHTLTVSTKGISHIQAYWNITDVIVRSQRAAAMIPEGAELEYVRTALLDSVRAHLIADVPVGAFLSAGLDSATIVGLARAAGMESLQTITLAFDEFRGKATDELPIAREIARYFDVRHECVTISMQEVEGDIDAFLQAMDQPTIDGLNTWFVSRAAAQAGLKVVLSGLGGDELLGGYPSFTRVPRRVLLMNIPSRIPFLGEGFCTIHSKLSNRFGLLNPKTAGCIQLGGSYEGAYQIQRGVFMPWQLPQHILDPAFAAEGLRRLGVAESEAQSSTRHVLKGFAKVVELESTRYMRNQLLRDTDWVAMAHSLEIRVPMVDHVLLEAVVGLAATGRLGPGKSILPATLNRALPRAALERPKTGFTVPIWKWLRKSPKFDAWKRNRLLGQSNIRDTSRWAYTILAGMQETKDVLK